MAHSDWGAKRKVASARSVCGCIDRRGEPIQTRGMARQALAAIFNRLGGGAARDGRGGDVDMAEALRIVGRNRHGRNAPAKADPRAEDGLVFPSFAPKFTLPLAAGASVFTIGSCFARNIEAALAPLGVDLPTRRFKPPKSEYPNRPSGLLNEFNPGAVAQRILDAFVDAASPAETIVPSGSAFCDLLLVGGADVSYERAVARRAEIADIYRALPRADAVIVTLGLVECWFDQRSGRYLNRMPPAGLASAEPGRFVFRRLGVAESLALLEPAFDRLAAAGKKTILSVSPVPLSTTFTPDDATVSDCYSKAVLRVCAEDLARRHANVDYFPSFEIVKSGGPAAYEEDGVHVTKPVVERITRWMVDRYAAPARSA